MIKTPKKLIEVALPLDDINRAGAAEKLVKVGKPTNLHLWWARRPMAVARAVIFAQMVNDPGYERHLGRGMNKEKAKIERDRLFNIIRKLVIWDNTNNESVLNEARAEILRSWRETCDLNRNHPNASELFNPDMPPAFHDPFSGGGVIPLEAQRLGLSSFATDLNPVAVLINKALLEFPQKFSNQSPVGPLLVSQTEINGTREWSNAKGLAEDIRRYGYWIRNEAINRIGKFYPKVALPLEHGGAQATVIAWLWARTVKSPNPAFSEVEVPLISSYVLSTKAGKEFYLKPVISGMDYTFDVVHGKPSDGAANGTKASGRGANFICLLSGTPIEGDYIKSEGQAGRIGSRLIAVVAEGRRGRVFLPASLDMEELARGITPEWKPDVQFLQQALGFRIGNYGMSKWADLFTNRQLQAMCSLSALIGEAKEKIKEDAIREGLEDSLGYANAVSTYLAFALSRSCDWNNSLSRWESKALVPQQLFGRQAIPMVWDYCEANPLSDSTGSFIASIENIVKSFGKSSASSVLPGVATQDDATIQVVSQNKCISTDPPYYDNIGYADLSDFFYVWLRKTLRSIYPELLGAISVPKSEELVATPARHGGYEQAESFFLSGMTQAMHRLAEQAHPAFPSTIYYAFKQSDTTDKGTVSTGWETFLEAVIRAGFVISGTWPLNTENSSRLRGQTSNALASSILLATRKRDPNAPTISRREFVRELKDELAEAVDVMIGGAEGISPVAPVDLAQAVIGPGMAVFSKYSAVLEADGSPMTVHSALIVINKMLTEGSDDFDGDTQFCLGWFDQLGWTAGEFGQADVLARAKGTSVDGVREAGVVEAGAGRVRLLKPAEYPADWAPENDNRTPVWEALHQMIRALQLQGESAAGALLARMPQRAEPIRNLAYRLYTLCERKGWADEARSYNELITSWLGIEAASHEAGHLGSQAKLDI